MKISPRKLNYALICASILLMSGACTNADKRQLSERVLTSAQSCPIRYAPGVGIDTIYYERDTVFYTATVTSPLIRFDVLREEQDLIVPALAEMVETLGNDSLMSDLQLCQRAGAKIRFKLTDGVEWLDIDIDPDYLLNEK